MIPPLVFIINPDSLLASKKSSNSRTPTGSKTWT